MPAACAYVSRLALAQSLASAALLNLAQVLSPPKLQPNGHVRADGEKGPGPQHMKDVRPRSC